MALRLPVLEDRTPRAGDDEEWSARARCSSHGSQPAGRDRRRSGRCAASRRLGGRHDRLARVWIERALGLEPDEADELGGGTFIEADLSDPDAPAAVLAAAEDAVGPLTALVAVHTESRLGGILDTEAADFDRHVAVNARRALLLAAEFGRHFRGEAGSGRIVAFTSGAVHGEVAYGASKAALERIVVAAATELGPLGITVNAVDPGPTDTGWVSPELRELLSRARRSAA